LKAEIMGYITGITNNHLRIVASMEKYGFEETLTAIHENVIDELNDLLTFVEDVPEETEFTKVVLAKEGVKMPMSKFTTELYDIIGDLQDQKEVLEKRVKELEESCQNMCDVDRNLQKKIKELKTTNHDWQNACIMLKEKNEELERQIEKWKKNDSDWQDAYNVSLQKIRELEAGE